MIKSSNKIWRASPCPLCGDQLAHPVYDLAEGRYVKCQNCHLVSVDPVPSAAQMQARADFWAEQYHKTPQKVDQHYSRPFQQVAFGATLQRLERYRQCGRLLDVGCGIGGFVHAAEAVGWESYGVDISPSVEIARAHGLKVLRSTLESAGFQDEYFDAVTLLDVIEHISNPRDLIREAARVLRPGGCLYLLTPNLESLSARILQSSWETLEPQDHLALYTQATLGNLLSLYHCEPVLIQTLDLDILAWKAIFSRQRSTEKRKTRQQERRRLIGFLVGSSALQKIRELVNHGLTLTHWGDKLIIEANRLRG
jgi:2-polyprenyl-3-methyl-5-hydroxy-6-metoxy-1,4-benzoquinol methylase